MSKIYQLRVDIIVDEYGELSISQIEELVTKMIDDYGIGRVSAVDSHDVTDCY